MRGVSWFCCTKFGVFIRFLNEVFLEVFLMCFLFTVLLQIVKIHCCWNFSNQQIRYDLAQVEFEFVQLVHLEQMLTKE